jgi:hypothetical protein
MSGYFGCQCAYVPLRTLYHPQFRQMSFYITVTCWQTVIFLSWFLLKLCNFQALSSEGLLIKLLNCLHPRMDQQYSLSFPLVQYMIISLATFACTVHSESRCALRPRHVDLVVTIEVAVEVCCCFTVFSC